MLDDRGGELCLSQRSIDGGELAVADQVSDAAAAAFAEKAQKLILPGSGGDEQAKVSWLMQTGAQEGERSSRLGIS